MAEINLQLRFNVTRDPKPSNLYRALTYGQEPAKSEAAMDIAKQYPNAPQGHHLSNFCNMWTWNASTKELGDVTNWLHIPWADFAAMAKWQPTGANDFERLKWFSLGPKGAMYMWYEPDHDPLEKLQRPTATPYDVMWGTLVIGGNVVQVEGFETISVATDIDSAPRPRTMARLVGFRKTDWNKPLKELVETGLVDRCFCAYGLENRIGDSPDGIRYSPKWSPMDWIFHRYKREVTHLYTLADWLVKL